MAKLPVLSEGKEHSGRGFKGSEVEEEGGGGGGSPGMPGQQWPGHGVPSAPQATGAAGTAEGSARQLLWFLMPGHFPPAFLEAGPVPQNCV